MKSTRKAMMAAVAVTSLVVLCAVAVSSAAAKPGSAGAAKVTISVASLIPGSKDAAAWVLADFPKVPAPMISAGCEDIESILTKGITAAMNAHNARPPVL